MGSGTSMMIRKDKRQGRNSSENLSDLEAGGMCGSYLTTGGYPILLGILSENDH